MLAVTSTFAQDAPSGIKFHHVKENNTACILNHEGESLWFKAIKNSKITPLADAFLDLQAKGYLLILKQGELVEFKRARMPWYPLTDPGFWWVTVQSGPNIGKQCAVAPNQLAWRYQEEAPTAKTAKKPTK